MQHIPAALSTVHIHDCDVTCYHGNCRLHRSHAALVTDSQIWPIAIRCKLDVPTCIATRQSASDSCWQLDSLHPEGSQRYCGVIYY